MTHIKALQFMFAGFVNHVEQVMLPYGETTTHQVSLLDTYNMPRSHNYNGTKCTNITLQETQL